MDKVYSEAAMATEKESLDALEACMRFVGMPMEERSPVKYPAWMRVLKGGEGAGSLNVSFWTPEPDAALLLAEQTIFGFRIRYVQFEPRYQAFAFREVDGKGELTVTNRQSPAYTFLLRFRKG
ncbi:MULTISPECIES: hypothetical protein [Cupriavidus]